MKVSKKILVAKIIPLSIVAFLTVTAVAMFLYSVNIKISNANKKYAYSCVNDTASQVDSYLEDGLSTIKTISLLYSKTLTSEECDVSKIKEIEETSSFSYIRFIDKETGYNYTSGGVALDAETGEPMVFKDREYYIEGTKGNSGIFSLKSSRITNERMICFYTPVYYSSSLCGVMVGYYSESFMKNLINIEYYGYASNTFITTQDGSIVSLSYSRELSSVVENGLDNIFELYSTDFVPDNQKEKLTAAVNNSQEASFTYNGAVGKSSGYVVPLKTTGWSLILAFPSQATKMLSKKTNESGMALAVSLGGTFLFYILWVGALHTYERTRYRKENLIAHYVQTSTTEIFPHMIYIDVEKRTYCDISRVPLHLAREGNYEDLINHLVSELSSENEIEEFRKYSSIEHIQMSGNVSQPSFTFHKEVNGRVSWETMTFIKVEEKDGKITKGIVTMQDVTIAKNRENKYQLSLEETNNKLRNSLEQEEQYRKAILSDSIMIFNFNVTKNLVENEIYAITNNKLIPVSDNLGLTPPFSFDALKQQVVKRIRPKYKDRYMELFDNDNLTRMFNEGKAEITFEFEIEFIKGYVLFLKCFVLLTRSFNGDIIAKCNAKDITSQKKKEMESQEQLDKRMKIIQSVSNVYFSTFYIDLANDSFEEIVSTENISKLIGASGCASEKLQVMCEKLIKSEYKSQMQEFVDMSTIDKRMEGKKIISLEYEGITSGWSRASLIPVDYNEKGKLISLIWATETIHEEKENELHVIEALKSAYEAANKANKAKSDFLSTMSHDIRTPMNGIIGMTAIAETHIDDKERVQDCLGKISKASNHLLSLINEILDMSKIESGKIELQENEFNLADLIDNLLVMTRPSIDAHKHKLIVDVSKLSHENVYGDSLRIQQVFTNLMSNAVKYTPDGGMIHLYIAEKKSLTNGIGCYQFIFEDNGIGMSEEFLKKLYDPFSRASDSRINKIQGTGLGMAITRNIVQMMGGTIDVKSELNKGSTFTVTIYLHIREDVSLDDASFRDKKIILFSLEERFIESTSSLLEGIGDSIIAVSSYDKFIKELSKENYFASIVDDNVLPLLEKNPLHKGNIIMATSSLDEIEQEARLCGVSLFVSKPVFRSRIIKLFKTLVGIEEEKENEDEIIDFEKLDYSSKRVLLAEDNDLNAEIAAEILGMAHFEVDRVENGKLAVDKIASCEEDYYALIFMDIQMPVMNGYQATKAIRSLDREYAKRIPILAMSANAFAEDVQASIASGMNAHISKPLDMNQLARELKKWIK